MDKWVVSLSRLLAFHTCEQVQKQLSILELPRSDAMEHSISALIPSSK